MADTLGSAVLFLTGDATQLERVLDAVDRRVQGVERSPARVTVTADTRQADQALGRLEDRTEGLDGDPVEIPVVVEGDREAEEKLRRIKQRAEEAEGPVQIPVGVDDRAAQTRIARIKEALRDAYGGFQQDGLEGLFGSLGNSIGGRFGGIVGGLGSVTAALGQIGLAASGLQAIFGALSGSIQQALRFFEGFVQESVRFNDLVQGASIGAAQFNRVFSDGIEIDGPVDRIRTARLAVKKELEQLAIDAAEINGATTQDLAEVFQLIVTNNATNGDLEKASELAKAIFSGLSASGTPRFQFQQEARALVTGDIDVNAQFARNNLQLSRDDFNREKARGNYADFLLQRLEPFTAAQELVSDSIVNQRSIIEETFQNIGREIGDTLLESLSPATKAIADQVSQSQDDFSEFGQAVARSLEPVIRVFGSLGGSLVQLGAFIANTLTPVIDLLAFGLRPVGELLTLVLDGFNALLGLSNSGLNIFGDLVRVAIAAADFFSQAFQNSQFKPILDIATAIAGQIDAWVKGAEQFSIADVIADQFEQVVSFVGSNPVLAKLFSVEDPEAIAANFRAAIEASLQDDITLQALQLDPSTQSVVDQANQAFSSSSKAQQDALRLQNDLAKKGVELQIKGAESIVRALEGQRQILQELFSIERLRAEQESAQLQARVNLAGSEEQRRREEQKLAEQQNRAQLAQLSQRRELLGREAQIQEAQLRVQQLQLQLRQKDLELEAELARLEDERFRKALADLEAKNRDGSRRSEIENVRKLIEQQQIRRQIAGQSLQLIAAEFGQLQQTAATQQEVNRLKVEQIGLEQQLLGIRFQDQRTQEAIQALVSDINRQTQAQQEQIRAYQTELQAVERSLNRQLDIRRRDTEIQSLQRRLSQAQSEGEIDRNERILDLLERRRNASVGTDREIIDRQLQLFGFAGETQIEIAERLRDLRLRSLEEERQAQERVIKQRYEELEIQQRINSLRLLTGAVDARGQLVAAQSQAAQLEINARKDLFLNPNSTDAQAALQAATQQQQTIRELNAQLLSIYGPIAAQFGQQALESLLGAFGVRGLGQDFQQLPDNVNAINVESRLKGLNLTPAPVQPVQPAPGAGGAPQSVGPLSPRGQVSNWGDPDGMNTGFDFQFAGGQRGARVWNPFSNLRVTEIDFQFDQRTGRGFGKYLAGIVTVNGKEFEVFLAHFDDINVKEGDVLGPGAMLGTQGRTGSTTAPVVSTHVNKRGGATVADAQRVLEMIGQAWSTGTVVPNSGSFMPPMPTMAPVAIPVVPASPPRQAPQPIANRRGLATYYGREDGYGVTPGMNITANGERFIPEAMTAAVKTSDRSLLGKFALVTDTETGRRVVVKINDTGSFNGDPTRVIDLSRGALQALKGQPVGASQPAAGNANVSVDFFNTEAEARQALGETVQRTTQATEQQRLQTNSLAVASEETTNSLAGLATQIEALREQSQDAALSPEQIGERRNLELAALNEQNRNQVRNVEAQAIEQVTGARTAETLLDQGINRLKQGGVDLFDAISNALSTALLDTENFGRALQNTISQIFIQLGTDLIRLAIQPFRDAFVSFIQGLFSSVPAGPIGGGGGGGLLGGLLGVGQTLLGGLGGGIFGGGASLGPALNFSGLGGIFLPGFAEGGITSGPSLAGEGRLREAVIPLPNGRSVPVDMRGVSGATAPTEVSLRLETVRVLDEEYVRAADVPGIIKQASQGGMNLTMQTLRSSPGARRRIGI